VDSLIPKVEVEVVNGGTVVDVPKDGMVCG